MSPALLEAEQDLHRMIDIVAILQEDMKELVIRPCSMCGYRGQN